MKNNNWKDNFVIYFMIGAVIIFFIVAFTALEKDTRTTGELLDYDFNYTGESR